jgi:plastocyanin
MKTNVIVALLVTALTGCMRPSSGEEQSDPTGLSGPSRGVVEGVVRLRSGTTPEPTAVENTTDPDVCGRHQTLEDLVVSATTGGVAHAIVALEDVPAEHVPALEPGRLVLDNRQCRFVPHAAVLPAGSTIEAVNSDPVLHTVHLYGPVQVNIALPLEGMRVSHVVERPGLIVVKCDVHGWMQAFVRVDAHPFHAVTDPSGAFRIAGVPPGEYTVSVWHERLGSMERRVQVRAGETARAEFEYSE